MWSSGSRVRASSHCATLGSRVRSPSRCATLGSRVRSPSRCATLGSRVRSPSQGCSARLAGTRALPRMLGPARGYARPPVVRHSARGYAGPPVVRHSARAPSLGRSAPPVGQNRRFLSGQRGPYHPRLGPFAGRRGLLFGFRPETCTKLRRRFAACIGRGRSPRQMRSRFFRIGSSLAKPSGVMGVRGRRRLFSMRPILARAALAGRGLDSENRPLNSGISS